MLDPNEVTATTHYKEQQAQKQVDEQSWEKHAHAGFSSLPIKDPVACLCRNQLPAAAESTSFVQAYSI